jgi:hypothetical protein
VNLMETLQCTKIQEFYFRFFEKYVDWLIEWPTERETGRPVVKLIDLHRLCNVLMVSP